MVLGRLKQNASNPNEVMLNVLNITVSNVTGTNVAVLHLATRPSLSDHIQPICLDSGLTFSVGSSCWSAGWSSGRGGGEEGSVSGCTHVWTASLTVSWLFLRGAGAAGAPDLGAELWKHLSQRQHLHRSFHPGAGEQPEDASLKATQLQVVS